jgi:hypothetical protein
MYSCGMWGMVLANRHGAASMKASFEAGGGGGFREDIGSFILVGIEIPAGCWELTARYGDAELSYVVLVEG